MLRSQEFGVAGEGNDFAVGQNYIGGWARRLAGEGNDSEERNCSYWVSLFGPRTSLFVAWSRPIASEHPVRGAGSVKLRKESI